MKNYVVGILFWVAVIGLAVTGVWAFKKQASFHSPAVPSTQEVATSTQAVSTSTTPVVETATSSAWYIGYTVYGLNGVPIAPGNVVVLQKNSELLNMDSLNDFIQGGIMPMVRKQLQEADKQNKGLVNNLGGVVIQMFERVQIPSASTSIPTLE